MLPRRRRGPAGDDHIDRRKLKSARDVLLLCTDGLWANLRDQDFVRFAHGVANRPLRETLTDLGTQAVESVPLPNSDNTSAAALRWRAA